MPPIIGDLNAKVDKKVRDGKSISKFGIRSRNPIITSHRYIITNVSIINQFPTGTDHRLVRLNVNCNIRRKRKVIKRNNSQVDREMFQEPAQQAAEKTLYNQSIDEINQKITGAIQKSGTGISKIYEEVQREKIREEKTDKKESVADERWGKEK